jgi:hypothetical protein
MEIVLSRDYATVTLPGVIFRRPVNPKVLYQVVRWQRAKSRAVRTSKLWGMFEFPTHELSDVGEISRARVCFIGRKKPWASWIQCEAHASEVQGLEIVGR